MTERATYPSLFGKAVLITGGASGIGADMVRGFAAQGAKVGFIDVAQEAAERLILDIQTDWQLTPWFRRTDVTDTTQLQSVITDFSKEAGGLHALINNAANDQRHDPLNVDEAAWRKAMAINLDSVFFGCQAALKVMRKSGGGRLINLSSINALNGPSDMPAYNSAKAALLGLTRSLAKQYGADGVRVNAILPGWVVTERQLNLWLTPEVEADWMAQVPLQERLMPKDITALALFLAADEGRMITGQQFIIDGGRT